MSTDNATKDYVQRRQERGKTKKEILRQLKRALCREIYRALTKPAITLAAHTLNLGDLRPAKGISQTQAAKALSTWPARISDIETERRQLKDLRTRYEQWLNTA